MGTYCAIGCSIIATFALGGAALAADHPANELPTVQVTTTKEQASLTAPDEIEAREQLDRVAGGANIVSSEEYKRGRAAFLADALRWSPGVFIQPRFGSEEARLSIRGSGLQRTFHGRGIRLLQDGVPLNQADGGFDFQAADPLSAAYVEVYRGANALQYGAATLGGAINFVSHTGYTASSLQAYFSAGSFDTFQTQLSSGQVFGKADYYTSLSYTDTNGFRDHARQENERFFSNFGYRFNDNLETRFYLTYVNSESDLPGSLTKADALRDPRVANTVNNTRNDQRDFAYLRLGNRTTYRWGRERVEVSGFWGYRDLYHPIFQVLDIVTDDYGLNIRYVNENDFFARKNIFTAGFYPNGGQAYDRRSVNRGRDVRGQRGGLLADAVQSSVNLDLYAENQHYVVPNLAIVLGSQLSYASRESNDRFLSNGDQSDSQTYYGFSPKVGVRYEITHQAQIFSNLSRSFEPPSFGELVVRGGLPLQLEPQRATTAELGSRGKEGRFSWDIAYYHSWVENELLSLNDANGQPLGTINAAKPTIHQGVELGLATHLGDRLALQQTYLWNDFRFNSEPVYGNNQLAGIPEHFYRAELRYEHPSGFYAGPNVEWAPNAYPVDFQNTLFADGYTLLGFRAGYRRPHGFSTFFEARNLTDEKYIASTGVIANANGLDQQQFLPGDGISFYGGVEFRY